MKFNKKSPRCWYYFLRTAINIIIGMIFLLFLQQPKSRNLRIVLFGHRLNGNTKALLDYIRGKKINDVEVSFMAVDRRYYKKLKKEDKELRVLSSENLNDIIYLLSSDAIVSTHGPSVFFLIRKLGKRKPKFVEVSHGLGHKGYVKEGWKLYHFYDKILTSSHYYKRFYVERWGFRDSQVVPAGWGRLDYFFNRTLDRSQILKKYHISNKYKRIVLIAPTWKMENEGRRIFPFGETAEEFFALLEKIGREKNTLFIFRTHINTPADVKKRYGHIRFLPHKDYPLTYEILYITDILVYDWSSISVDYIALNRPIICLNVKAPFKHGFTLPLSDRIGYLVNNTQELEKTIQHCIDYPKEFSVKFKERRKKFLSKLYDNNLDGKSAARYLEVIRASVRK
ncbi:CDP-glycerol glycerophosphotransferase family protein [Candidatus Woesearchaeota archaeon]|nr:CDP-glycerol glycerophosphotransferase family protein [Candidatus Woesearchaeota archaeon]